MRICEIHIDGFGIFADRHITGLGQGLNVICGGNEFGKSTLLAFVRRILFGFPRGSSGVNPYPALSGGAYGGRLICQLGNGEQITISRTLGAHGGQVIVSATSRQLTGQDELSRILEHLTGGFYQNVYAISLDELQEISTLQGEEIRGRIYGAGLGLGSISLIDIMNGFRKESDSLYKPRGSAQKVSNLYQQIRELEKAVGKTQQEIEHYDGLLSECDELLRKVSQTEDQIRSLEASRQALENKDKLYPVYIEYIEAQSELSKLEQVPSMAENTLRDFEALKVNLANLKQQIDGNAIELRDLELEKGRMIYNERIFAQEATIVSLQNMSEKYKSAVNDIDTMRARKTSLEQGINKRISQIQATWTIDDIRKFNLSHSQKDKILGYRSRFDEANNRADEARAKLEYHIEKKSEALSTRFAGPKVYRYAIYAITLLGLAGLVWGSLSLAWGLVSLFGIILLAGFCITLMISRGNGMKTVDPLEKKLTEQSASEKSEYTRLDREWKDYLHSIGLDENLSTSGAIEVVNTIHGIQSDLASLDELDSRIKNMQTTIDKAKELHDQVMPCIDTSRLTDDLGTNIQILVNDFNDTRNVKLKKEGVSAQIKKVADKITRLEQDRKDCERYVLEYVSLFGALDERDFRRKCAVFARRAELSRKINECRRSIQTSVGVSERYNSFVDSMSSTNPQEIQKQLREIQEQLNEMAKERDQMIQTRGELLNQAKQLSSSDNLLVKQSEIELKKQQLQDCARDWTKSQIALLMLEIAVSKYESTRQPEVIKSAESYFKIMTGNSYSTIVKPIDADELQIRDRTGKSKGVIQMSRGTKEQLYLAMRLGLIEEYEKRSEPMPIIMDDVLANFDDDRGSLAAEAIRKFSENRQVLVLTCHKNVFEVCRDLGANVVTIA